ncbi:hypothetical protein Tco_0471252 [Tanacetum coccineum]
MLGAMNMTLQSSIKDRILAAQKDGCRLSIKGRWLCSATEIPEWQYGRNSYGFLSMQEDYRARLGHGVGITTLRPVGQRSVYYSDFGKTCYRALPLDEIQVDAKLNFMEEPVEILEREFKKLKRSRIAIVKVRWNSKRGPEFRWERENQMKLKYLHLFSVDCS